ncbi:MAG TPA: hypothetical protein PKE04_09730 [Clostridia bacterium]|nr:hypothetical protein [Clostridia bacterium]
MKRLTVFLLAFCLLYGTASAEALRVLNPGWTREVYQAMYPDRTVEEVQIEYDEIGRSNAQRLMLENPDSWDVAFIWTDECDLAALDAAGLLMDLRDEDALAGRVKNMHAPIREVVTEGDRVLAVPSFLFSSVMQLAMLPTLRTRDGELDLLTPLGLSMADAPQTFDELCDLAERYMALPKETRKGRAFHLDAAAGNPKDYFLSYLIELYTAQYCDADGAISYDTPEFRHALERLESMAAALQADPKITYGQTSAVYGLVYDGGPSLLSDYNELLYLRIGDNASVPAKMGMLVVNANTARKAEALDFAICAVENHEPQFGPELYETMDYEALARRSCDQNIEAQIHQKEDQSVIDRLIRERDSGEYRYQSRESIERYAQNVAPRLTFARVPWVDRYAIVKEYIRGRLDVEGLIESLNNAAEKNKIQ